MNSENLPSPAEDPASYTLAARRTSLKFVYVIAALFITACATLIYLCEDIDQHQVRHSVSDASKAIETKRDKIGTALADYAFWNDAYKHMGETIDAEWAYDGDNIGPSLHTTYGLDGIFVIGPDLATRYAIRDGKLSDIDAKQWITGDLNGILEQARILSAEDGYIQGYLSVDGVPAIVSAAMMRPDSSYDDFAHLSYLVFVDVLTADKLQLIDQAFDLNGLTARLGADELAPEPKLILRTEPGIAFTLQWQSEELGRTLLSKFLPMLFALGAVFAFMVWRLRKNVLLAAQVSDSAQRALRISEQRFRNISEAASDWIWETDTEQHLTYLSERFTHLTGLPADAWLGRPLSELLSYQTDTFLAFAAPGAVGRKPIPCQMQDSEGRQRFCQLSTRAVQRDGNLLGYQGTVCDVTEEIEAKARIEHISQHDTLTGLANRHRLSQHLAHRLAEGVSSESPFYLLALDLDRFKPINDTFGHAAGDTVLREVAKAIKGCMRDADLVARLGGDEFVIVTSNCPTSVQIERLCERILERVKETITVGANDVNVGASIGIACAPRDGLSPEDLLQYADIALYEAKTSGRNNYKFYEHAMHERIMERRQLEMDLRQALGRKELRLEFQPRYEASSKQLAGAEALARWDHPTRGLLMPASFIPLAEETGLIIELSDWVLHEACMNALTWGEDLMVSVNLSPVDFQQPGLTERVKKTLKNTGIEAHRLELEITESVMLDDASAALETMNALKALGVRLSMDDFGTGYSSLSYLRSYPFDAIKIDSSFIAGLGQSENSAAIVHAIVSMGRALSLTVTAEGIETLAQLDSITAFDCDQAQGFHLGRPMHPALFRELAAAHESTGRSERTVPAS